MMRVFFLLIITMICFIADAAAGTSENVHQETNNKEIISEDDQKVVEMMEFLEIMDVLDDSETFETVKELNVLLEDE